MQVFLLPDLGEGLTEAELVNWLVKVGDEIRVDQPIAEVETAKSIVEVPSPFAGVVAVLHGEAGQTLDVGKPLLSVEAGSAAGLPSGLPAAPAADSPAESFLVEASGGTGARSDTGTGAKSDTATGAKTDAMAASGAEAATGGSGNVLIGYGTSGHGAGGRTRPRKVASGETGVGTDAAVSVAPAAVSSNAGPAKAGTGTGTVPLVISPLVRKLARDNGVALAGLTGTGRDGLILRKDVEAALPAAFSPAGADTGADTAGAAAEVDPRSGLEVRSRTPIKGLRRTVAANLSRSRSEIPEATVWVDVDATALVQLRQQMKRAETPATAGSTPGLLAFIARFVIAGLAKFPELNTRVDPMADGNGIVAFDGVNLGFAAQTERGLMVPSIRHAEKLSARQLDGEIRRLTAVAREGKASPAELTSGTFTLNNYGVFGVDGSAAIINYPEVAILGVGRIIDKPWVVAGELAVRKLTELTLVFDHRVCDGGTAGGFLRYVADAIENPGAVLADL
ncbi:2-oxo acid dehydrogenase subunit E2 [Paenarthrobacter sp. Z7-10]|uniref:dihydrolipoamide acetyltransferase family protein n=1 Tax=Paenarthrobacter sp. Z7-10 TaxID=2787635 RepID=UPI0022A9BFDE|nr:dihydrolipoamide acetyltransferase family protein [Paenarthrobacter sp. Z7-10]MCZ2402315.1 2-oxo acid dehydrogenase subunit E2 [Paenarthrobacter sp. Z7-10]